MRRPPSIVRRAALLIGTSLVLGAAAEPDLGTERAVPEPVWPPVWWLDPASMPEPAAIADEAMVATAHPLASHAALEALARGGTAVDAAVAAQLVLNVVEPQSSGIGGGCFIVYLPPGAGEPTVIDGRESAPRAVSESLFLGPSGEPIPYVPDRVTGGRPVGVPGTLAAVHLAHARWGTLDWASLVRPAERLAREGFPVSRRLHRAIQSEAARMRPFAATRLRFFGPGGEALGEGEWLVQPELASTFALVAAWGPDAFYRGAIAQDIVDAVRHAVSAPGLMTMADLAAYRPIVRRPVRGRYRGIDVYGVGPPSSGGLTTIEILHILEGFDLSSLTPGSAEAVHLVLEAQRLAFADRNRYIGDADVVVVPVDSLLSKTFAARRRAEIDPERASGEAAIAAEIPPSGPEGRETTHLSIRDPHGGLLAMTTTIEQPFGSGMVVPGRGFFLNNELSDFDAMPLDDEGRPRPNRVEPGKRPRSSMAPTLLVRDGRPLLAVGSPGGSRIIGITLSVILGVVDWGMDVQEAIDFPRAINRGGAASDLESLYFDDAMLHALYGIEGTIERLRSMGHVVEPPTKAYRGVGGVHAVRILDDGRVEGGADPRREGVAVGF
jgi:gamma-glutamyltranspeptidase/glutathione hydrolase